MIWRCYNCKLLTIEQQKAFCIITGERFVKELLKREELDYDDIKEIFDEYEVKSKKAK